MSEQVAALLRDVENSADPRDVEARLREHAWLRAIELAQLAELLSGLLVRDPPAAHSAAEQFLARTLEIVAARFRRQRGQPQVALTEAARESAIDLYRRLGADSRARQELLTLLAASSGEPDLRALAELTASDPPASADRFLAPLFQNRDYDPAPLFPRLLDALEHPALAAPVVDLTNYLTRERRVPVHPAVDRSERLASLLGELIQRLARIEESPADAETEEAWRQVNEGVPLIVGLCDALGLIGNREHVGKLHQALDLGHRRIRTEAAYALAKLGDKAGEVALAALAAEGVARLRVLSYAQELGLLDKIDAQHQSPAARAEAELIVWLSDPRQMGLPPGTCELFDRREQYWPGYDDLVECFLFHFSYRLHDAVYSNVGIVGPLTHALTADLADLPVADIYAAFAGWQAEHADVYEIDAENLNGPDRREAEQLERRLHEAGCEETRPIKLGLFFGERVLVAAARKDGVPGYAVIDSQDHDWRPAARGPRPLGPDELYFIYKGRKLLKAFNPEV